MAFLGQRFGSMGAEILAPYAFGMYFVGVSVGKAFGWKTRELLASGHCVLFRNDAYDFTGGHRAFIRSTLDRLELARLGKRHRLRFTAVRAEDLGVVRSYESLGSIWDGFRRHSADYLNAPVILWAVWMSLYAPVLAWLVYEGEALATCAFAAAPMLATLGWYRNPLAALMAPVAIYGFPVLALHSALARFFGFDAPWKGRNVF